MRYREPEKFSLTQTLPVSRGLGRFFAEESYVKKSWGSWGRAVLGSSVMVVFAVVILLVSMLAGASPTRVRPYELANSSGQGEGQISTSGGGLTEEKTEYYLAYPGVLPDSPLYKLKASRDRVLLWLTFDKLKKAERELLYADKRINAAIELVEGGKSDLGVSTATKAEKYLEASVSKTVGLQENGRDVKSHLLTLEKASKKHLEILREMGLILSGQEKNALDESIVSTEMQLQKVQQTLREAN